MQDRTLSSRLSKILKFYVIGQIYIHCVGKRKICSQELTRSFYERRVKSCHHLNILPGETSDSWENQKVDYKQNLKLLFFIIFINLISKTHFSLDFSLVFNNQVRGLLIFSKYFIFLVLGSISSRKTSRFTVFQRWASLQSPNSRASWGMPRVLGFSSTKRVIFEVQFVPL